MLAMLDIQAHPGSGRAIRTGLVSDHHARCAGWLSHQLAQELLHCELLRCAPALAALNQGAENKAVSIDGANMALRLAVDRDHDARRDATCRRTEARAEGSCLRGSVRTSEPSTIRFRGWFMADDDPARREQVLDHPEAERNAEIEPDSLLDDFGRELIAAINRFRCRHHHAQIADVRRYLVNLTVPQGHQPDDGLPNRRPFMPII